MGTQWFKADYKGVRYRKHPERKHGVKFDQYFVITYKLNGKTKSEALGWASEGFTASEGYDRLNTLKKNRKSGNGPCTLSEMRETGEQERKEKKRLARARKKLDISFKAFFTDTFMPDAETRWKPETARKAREHVRNWIDPVTGANPMREIGLDHVKKIKAHLAGQKASPRHQQYVFRTFAMVWNAARDHGLVNIPCPTQAASFRLPKVDNERQRYLTLAEEKRLLNAILKRGKQPHDMALVSLDAGLRFGEIAGLPWGAIDPAQGTIRVLNTKGKRDRFVPMTRRLQALFDEMETGASKALVFPNTTGGVHKQIPSSFVRAIADAKLNEDIDDPKLRASFHTLRHTYASRMVQAGVDLYRVQRLLGHSTPIMTARYGKLADDDLKEAVETMERAAERKKGAKVIQLRKKA